MSTCPVNPGKPVNNNSGAICIADQIISLNRNDSINEGKPEVLYTEGVTKKEENPDKDK